MVVRLFPWSLAIALLLLLGACSDDGRAETSPDTSPVAQADNSSNATVSQDARTSESATDASDGESTSMGSTGSTASGSSTSAPASSAPVGPPTVRLGPVTLVRTEACPSVTVAPTFTLSITSDRGTDNAGPEQASQLDVSELTSAPVAPDATFTVEGDWSLNVQMLEHLSGTTRGTVHTETSRLADQISINGTPIDISWDVTQSGNEVSFTNARFAVSPSCVQIQPGTMVTFSDAGGSRTAGSIDPAFDQPADLPLDQPVTIFAGTTFETTSNSGWTLAVTVIEHWNGRNHHSNPHTTSGSVTATVPGFSDTDPAWELRYTVEID